MTLHIVLSLSAPFVGAVAALLWAGFVRRSVGPASGLGRAERRTAAGARA